MSNQDRANDPEQVELFVKHSEAAGVSRRTFLKILAAAGASSAILAACGAPATTAPPPANTTAPSGNTPAPQTTSASQLQPRAGQPVADAEQVWRDSVTDEPASMDFNGDLYCAGLVDIWAGLLRFDYDYKAVPYGAKSIDIKDNVWTFHLDPNWKWTNGDQVTANDFEWSWHRMLHPSTAAPYSSLLYDVKGAETYNNNKNLKGTNDELSPANSGVGIKALDKTTLEVTLNGPRGYFGAIIAYYAALANHRPTVEKNGETFKTDAVKSSEPGVIVSNGQFTVTYVVLI